LGPPLTHLVCLLSWCQQFLSYKKLETFRFHHSSLSVVTASSAVRTPHNSIMILAKLDLARSVAIRLLLLVCQEGLHHLNIDAPCVDQVMRVLPVKEIQIDLVRLGKFSDDNTVVIFVVQREEDVHLLDLIPVVLFRFVLRFSPRCSVLLSPWLCTA
jgi:hypothetical protein